MIVSFMIKTIIKNGILRLQNSKLISTMQSTIFMSFRQGEEFITGSISM